MIIRSQDKKQIVNFDVCHIGITRDNCVIAVNGLVASPSEILRGVIGKYSTEEKAVKVLDMIQDTYVRDMIYCCVMSGTAGTIAEYGEEVTKQAFETAGKVFVFEMPKDCEV